MIDENTYDTIVVGAGPAGTAACVYAARKKLKTLLITENFGGQSIVSDDIQNWIGEPHISGFDLAKKLEAHIRAYQDIVEIKAPDKVVSVKTIPCQEPYRPCDFLVETAQKNTYTTKTLIITSGARRKTLNVAGEEKFKGKGISYCSTCDAPLFTNKDVAVVGGGNAGLEAVQDLFSYAREIYLIDASNQLKGDTAIQEEVKKNSKLKKIILNAQIVEIFGDAFVLGLRYIDLLSEETKELACQGVFVEIGSVPNSEIVKNLVQTDQWGQIIIDAKHGTTSHPGIFAAGDVTNDPYKQNNISAGDGVRAALSAYAYINQRKKQSPAAG